MKKTLVFIPIALAVFLLILGCNSQKPQKTETGSGTWLTAEEATNKTDDYSYLLEYGLSRIGFFYDDVHGNSYWPERNSFYLYTPDTEVLLRLPNIERLNIEWRNPITDISFLENLSGLKSLIIDGRGSKIENLEALKYLVNLEVLDLGLNPGITDISPIANLKNLKRLKLYSTGKIENIEFVFALTNLEYLYLYLNEHTLDMAKIASLSKLEELYLYSPAEIDLTPIGTLQNLKQMWIGSPKTVNFSNLKNLQLECLDFLSWWGYEGEFKLDGLHHLIQLKTLGISYIDVYDVTPILKIPNLERVYFSDNFVDITPLAESKTIKTIEVHTYYQNEPKYKEISDDVLALFEKNGIEVQFTDTGD